MGIIAWIVLGLIAGLIARALYPGSQPGGLLATILLGIVGALLGGWIGGALTGGPGPHYGFTFMGVIWSVVGALIVLFLYGLATGRRRRTIAP
jgi:uncharacterized membrane protein YeaQ/YmgE (transglycosylase-associated protein family)